MIRNEEIELSILLRSTNMMNELKSLEIFLKPVWNLCGFLTKRLENLKFDRDNKRFDDFNRFYGPLFFEKPTYCYAYLIVRLMNEGPKILLRQIKSSIFNMGDQKYFDGKILETPPTEDRELGSIRSSLYKFPDGYDLIGLPNKMEIPAESCRDYFFALRFPGFETNNVEGRKLKSLFKDEFSTHVGFDLILELVTSRNNRFSLKTMVWSVDLSKRDPAKELKM